MCKQRVGSEKSSLQFSKMVFTAAVLYVSPVKGIKKEGKEKKIKIIDIWVNRKLSHLYLFCAYV